MLEERLASLDQQGAAVGKGSSVGKPTGGGGGGGGDDSGGGGGGSAAATDTDELNAIWETTPAVKIEGESLKTWSFPSPDVEQVQVSFKSDGGRPLHAQLDLWHGPDYTATTTKIYTEDGNLRPFNAVIATPKGMNTVALYNTGNLEFPFTTCVKANENDGSPNLAAAYKRLYGNGTGGRRIQGGSITSFPFDPNVESVQVLLKTDGRNLKARVELMQGPNNDKQVIEFYASDGYKRPFYAVIESPGSGNVIRLLNQNTVEFPFDAWVEPYRVDHNQNPFEAVIGGDEGGGFSADRQWGRS